MKKFSIKGNQEICIEITDQTSEPDNLDYRPEKVSVKDNRRKKGDTYPVQINI